MPLRDLSDLEAIKNEVSNGNILILRITPLANKSIEDVKRAVNDLYEFAESISGDIARLGEERVVICPPKIRIWREKAPVQTSRYLQQPKSFQYCWNNRVDACFAIDEICQIMDFGLFTVD